MPLTPADVHNVAFNKPPIGKRGFDAEDVDPFLDEVARELARLIDENLKLRAQMERGDGPGGASARPDLDSMLAAELHDKRARLDLLQRDRAAAEHAARAIHAELEQVRTQAGPAFDGHAEEHARVLTMAQRTADNHLADARSEADKLLSDARSTAQRVTAETQDKADALERDARQRHQKAMVDLDAERTAIQNDIDQLTQFAHEYHTRLKTHLDRQLRDLDGKPQTTQVEGNPAQ
ncbi:DivIVA domain-containing protein [Micromonospora sp. CB01531]|uniref:DivIVA domain-containing protein n=1 Tax=Micromonospora sp. CB01531 TaxID=1718947 RepID=UPI00093FCBA4|nr:DivIVA domain-containing protein [Micromonospora sp. CB01531]OKI54863.1 cell division protein DivIVA [Micromonospora sp. CB01531]